MATKRSARAARISLDEFTQLTFQSVLRASELHKLPPNRFPGPIIFGIIWWPQGMTPPGAGIGAPRIGQ